MEQKSKTYIRPIVYVMISVFLIIGYAYLTSNLTINGASLLKKATWDVHFENVQVKDGSVTGEQVTQEPEIDTDRTTVSFHVNLKKPGDYYEFTVDAVNAGTIDAMIDNYSDLELTAAQQKYLETSITYEDGEEVLVHQQLLAGDTAVYKVRIAYKLDLEADDLPSNPEQLDLEFSVEFVQRDNSAIKRSAESALYNVLKDEAENGGLAIEYTGAHQDSMDSSRPTKKIYHWKVNNQTDLTNVNAKNNVYFGGYCWKILRTTDTGGVKLIYNGENKGTEEAPNCDNTGTDTQITLNIDGQDVNTFAFSGTGLKNSPAYNGYMYGTVYTYNIADAINGAYYGTKFEYGDFDNNGSNEYRLLASTVSITQDSMHHYTCNLAEPNGTCTTLRYYYVGRAYVDLTDGDGIEDAMRKMQTNTNNSNAKDIIDTWYARNIINYANKLEDTIWCNDRSVGNNNNNGWIAQGGDLNTNLNYGAFERSNKASNTSILKNHPNLVCSSKNDRFTVSNAIGNLDLIYPIATLTEDEIVIAGGIAGVQSVFYLNNGNTAYWTMSPSSFKTTSAQEFAMAYSSIDVGSTNNSAGLRPSISLKNGITITDNDADGTVSKPYVIK